MSEGASPGELDLGQTIRGFVPGQKLFARYTLKAVLGRGGMGIVWRAFDEELERDVALKFLPELIMHDKSLLRDLKRETQRSLELTHPHIVRIYDFIPDPQSACISMEFVDGDTFSNLRSEKSNNVFEVPELEEYVRQLCDALQYAHTKARIVHRDLKPANLMLNSRSDLKVADFGISRSLSDSVSMVSMQTSGTLVFMSPQQLDGEQASPLDDIYSLGATLYELLTSKPPFYSGNIDRQIREKTPVAMSAQRTQLHVQSAAAIPREWEETVAACLQKNPTKRPASAREVALRLGLTGMDQSSSPAADRSPGAHYRPASRWTRKRGFAATAIALLLVCGASAGWWFGVEKPRREAEGRRVAQERERASAQVETGRLAEQKRKQDEADADAAKARTEEATVRAAEEAKKKEETARAAEEQHKREQTVVAATPPVGPSQPASPAASGSPATTPAVETSSNREGNKPTGPMAAFAGKWEGRCRMRIGGGLIDGFAKTPIGRQRKIGEPVTIRESFTIGANDSYFGDNKIVSIEGRTFKSRYTTKNKDGSVGQLNSTYTISEDGKIMNVDGRWTNLGAVNAWKTFQGTYRRVK